MSFLGYLFQEAIQLKHRKTGHSFAMLPVPPS